MRGVAPILVLSVAAISLGCGRVDSSGLRTGAQLPPWRGHVVIRATDIPPRAQEVGRVEANGTGVELPVVMEEFARRVADIGGNFGKIDQMSVRFETITTSRVQTYPCGNTQCTRTVPATEEVGTTLIQGRAFRFGGTP